MEPLHVTLDTLDEVRTTGGRGDERGAGVVEWLGISALSIALLATIFTALNTVGADLVDYIRTTLGV